MKCRHFTLRTVLIANACIAFLVAYLCSPTYHAIRFSLFVLEGKTADALLMLDHSVGPDNEHRLAIAQPCEPPDGSLRVSWKELSFKDLRRGRRSFTITYDRTYSWQQFEFHATAFRILPGTKIGRSKNSRAGL